MNTTSTHRLFQIMPALLACLLLVGCGGGEKDSKDGKDGKPTTKDQTGSNTSLLPDGVLVTNAPQGAQTVGALKKSAKEGDEVVMRVVIGGREKPIVNQRAVVTVVDAGTFNNCLSEDDHCETPWDYCCVAPEELLKSQATFQILDAKGSPLAIDLTQANFKPLTTLVVKGKVGPRPDPNALVVNASQIFIEPAATKKAP